MSCCGQKRAGWRLQGKNEATRLNQVAEETDVVEAHNEQKEPPPRTFEYTGSRSLKVKGRWSGNTYFFRFRGHQLKVSSEDTFALIAEPDLKVLQD